MEKRHPIARRIAVFCQNELDEQKGETLENVERGIIVLTQNLLKTMILVGLVYYLHIWKYTLVFMVSFVLLRHFSFGIHLRNGWACLTWGLINYIGSSYIAINISFHMYWKIFIFALCFYFMWKYAPSGTDYRPIGKLQKKPLKENTLVCLSLLFIFSLFLSYSGQDTYGSIIIIAMIAQTINVLPITYFIFRIERE